MSGLQRRRRGKAAALAAAAICSVLSLFLNTSSAAASPLLSISILGLPGVPLTLTTGDLSLPIGQASADLSNGANGEVNLSIGVCLPLIVPSCKGVLAYFSLNGDFKDQSDKPLYSDSDPAAISWTCNTLFCPPPRDFVRGSSTLTKLQVEEFQDHTMYVALRNPDGTYQSFAPAPACNGTDGAPLPTGTIDPTDTGGRQFCVDVGAISRSNQRCDTVCSAWSGSLTLPILFVEDPRFMGT
jgi:hypothetical protein